MENSHTIQSLEQAVSVINFRNMDRDSEIQLAAELGKFLLDRNTVLEEVHEKNKRLITEQQAEIDKLICESVKLQESNVRYQRVAEQLELTILELERNNLELKKQHSVDKTALRELKEKKKLLQQRCDELQKSQEFMEEKLQKVEIQIEQHQNERKLESEPKFELSINEEPKKQVDVDKTDEDLIDQISYLSTNLSDCRCEIANYQDRIELMEHQIALLLQKNTDLEDIISSKSHSKISGCSSLKVINSTSLLEEIHAANNYNSIDSFAAGCLITSTPPKASQSKEIFDTENVSDYPTIKKAANNVIRQLTNEFDKEIKHSEKQVRINVCIEIDQPSCENVKRGTSSPEEHKGFTHLARKFVVSSNKTVKKGLSKSFRKITKYPKNYLAILILWSNKDFILGQVRLM